LDSDEASINWILPGGFFLAVVEEWILDLAPRRVRGID
jgi:hypothetical protein